MKKIFILFIIVAVLLGVYLGAVHLSGGAFPAPQFLQLGGERGQLRRISLAFLEDIEFKDFDNAAHYHEPELQDTVDIPFLLQRLFHVKPEALDIMDFETVFVKIDSSQLRARAKVRIKVKLLLNSKIETQELMLFYYRKDLNSRWYMKLEDSLRNLKAENNKKH